MRPFKTKLATIALLCGTACLPAFAASSAASSASDSIGTSVGSLSGSIEQSSKGSSRPNRVAEGDYKVIEVTAAADRPGLVRLKLQAVAEAAGEDSEFFLYLPQKVADQAHIAQGDTVAARTRPYGVEFARGEPRQAFFLVLADTWYRELQTTAVAL